VLKPAANRSTDDDTARRWLTRHWRPQLKRSMGTILVVTAHELGEQREQMLLTQHDDVVKTLLAKGPHYPFRHRVRQRRPVGRSDVLDSSAGELAPEVSTVHIVPTMDQVLRLFRSAIRHRRHPPTSPSIRVQLHKEK